MTGGVNSALREMNVTGAVILFAQPSQVTRTWSPIAMRASMRSGMKKRTLILPGGSTAMIGRLAGTVSPGRK